MTRARVVALGAALACAWSLPLFSQRGSGIAVSVRPADAPAWFIDVAAAAGVTFRHVNGASPDRHLHEIMSGGGLFFDYDNDGWLDIFLVDGGSLTDPAVAARARHRLFRNRGNGTFEDRTASSGITHRSYGMGACSADYDNDGLPDLYVTAIGGNALYRNAGGKAFVDVTTTAGVGSTAFATSCAFGDLDRDGDVDLFVVNYVDARLDNNIFCGDAAKRMRIYCHPLNFKPLANILYRNNGNGTFTDVSAAAGVGDHRGNGLGVVMGDYDGDGWLDVFVANDTTPNFLFHNDGKGRFSERALRSGVAMASDGRARAGMGTDFGDVDGDGDLDLFVTNHELETHTLYRNIGDGLFSEMTAVAGLSTPTLPFVGFGTVFVDHDNDGDLDIGIVNGHVVNIPTLVRPGATLEQRKLLFVNDGRRMREIGRQAGPGFARRARRPDVGCRRYRQRRRPGFPGDQQWRRRRAAAQRTAVARRRRVSAADRYGGQPQRGRRPHPRHGRRQDVRAGSEGRLELSGAERSAPAHRPGRDHAAGPGRDSLARRQRGNDPGRGGRPAADDHRRPRRDRAHATDTPVGVRRKGQAAGACAGGLPPELPAASSLEVHRHVEADEPRVQDLRRPQPGGAVVQRIECLLERGPGVGVEQVVEVEPDVGPGSPEAQDLREAHVDGVDPIGVELAGQGQVDGGVGGVAGERAPERRDHLGVADGVVGRQPRTVGGHLPTR